MDQIVVPQFLDVEDRIFGPITVRQFIELLVAGLLIFISYKIFDFSLFVVSAFILAGITLIVAFVKINGQNFHLFLLNFFGTMKNPKLKVWNKKIDLDEIKKHLAEKEEKPEAPRVRMARKPISSSKLSELALIVDTGGVYRGEEDI